jgi:hypothetical protein
MSARAIVPLYGIALLSAAGLIYAASRQIQREEPQRIRFEGAQASADSLTMPADGSPDMRFRLLSPWETAVTPVASRFDPPLGALVYNAQPFWEMNVRRGGHHTGDDLNGIGGIEHRPGRSGLRHRRMALSFTPAIILPDGAISSFSRIDVRAANSSNRCTPISTGS